MTGPYAQVGARLVERGYSAIPIMPGTKRPGTKRRGEWVGLTNWRGEYGKRLPSRFEIQTWSQSEAGVCVVTGPGSRDLVAVDIDTDDDEIKSAIVGVLPATAVRKAGAKGETLFFRGPAVTESKSWNIGKTRVCDLIGPGRQTVVPPSLHPDTGEPYRWTGPDALEDVSSAELPELPGDAADRISVALVPFGYEPEPTHQVLGLGTLGDADNPHRALNEAALARLDAWVPGLGLYRCRRTPKGFAAVATWRASNTGRPIERRKLNLHMTPEGITDFGDGPRGFTALDLVMAAADCDLDTAFRFLAEALDVGSGVTIALKAPALVPEPDPAEGWDSRTAAAQEAAIVALTGYPREDDPPREPLEPLTVVPGVVGQLVDWITATARRPNRVLALGAAVTIVGTLIGRRAATPTRSGTHLYVATLAPTGSGKQHALNCLMRAMAAAKAEHHIGPSEFISMPAVINFLMSKPLAVCPQDEFGAFLKRVNGRRASGFEASISKILRSIWGISFEAMPTPEWAGRKSEVIKSPAISIYGLSTHTEFYEGLQGSDLSNGFLNRFLVMSTQVRATDVTPEIEPGPLPDALVSALGALYNWTGSQLGTSRLNDVNLDPKPDILPWANSPAQATYMDLIHQIQEDIDRAPELEHFLARTAEIALRLATIRAAGRWGREATIDLSDVEWGRDVADICGRALAAEARSYMAETERQSWSNKVLRIIMKRGTVKTREIQQSLRNAIKQAEIKDILAGLIEAGSVEELRNGAGLVNKVTGYRFMG
jgi:hypothetical protein